MTGVKTIVFGPTGKVGSAAARFLHDHGVDVVLAMRDPRKPIPNLGLEDFVSTRFQRVQADLTKPETAQAAVSNTGAQSAFVYCAPDSPDHLKATMVALKAAGIKYVVYLSSISVIEKRDVESADAVDYPHAQVEINIEETFGVRNYVAVRPAWFASNIIPYLGQIHKGEVRIPYADSTWDWICPDDIGAVCGALLIRGPQPRTSEVVHLVGPEILSQRDAASMLGKAVGKAVKIVNADEQEGVDMYKNEFGWPEGEAEWMVAYMKARAEGRISTWYEGPAHDDAVLNIQRYTGNPPTRFQRWVEQNTEDFVSVGKINAESTPQRSA